MASVGSLKTKAATVKLSKGFMYKRIPIVDEFTPFKAYKLSQSGKIVNTTDSTNTPPKNCQS